MCEEHDGPCDGAYPCIKCRDKQHAENNLLNNQKHTKNETSDLLNGIGRKPHSFLDEKFCNSVEKFKAKTTTTINLDALDELFPANKEIKIMRKSGVNRVTLLFIEFL